MWKILQTQLSLKRRRTISGFPVGKRRLRVKVKQHNPSDFLSVCVPLLAASHGRNKSLLHEYTREVSSPGTQNLYCWAGSCWNTGCLLLELTGDYWGVLVRIFCPLVSGLSLYLAFSICSFRIHSINAWMMSIHLESQNRTSHQRFLITLLKQ